MVQLKYDLPVPKSNEPDNTYWAVGDDAKCLQQKKAKHSDYPSKILSSVDRAVRRERGLLNCHKCTITELRAFATSRRLKLPTKSRNTKADYIAILQEADDEPVFRFSEVPPELRAMIHKEYYRALPILPPMPHQPPLTLASKLLRKESLPLYYSESVFTLKFQSVVGENSRSHALEMPCFAENDIDLLGSGRLDANALAKISRFRLYQFYPSLLAPYIPSAEEGKDAIVAGCDVDLSGKSAPKLNVWEDQALDCNFNVNVKRFWSLRRKRLGPAIMSILEEVWARPGPGKLRQMDVDALVAAVEHAFE